MTEAIRFIDESSLASLLQSPQLTETERLDYISLIQETKELESIHLVFRYFDNDKSPSPSQIFSMLERSKVKTLLNYIKEEQSKRWLDPQNRDSKFVITQSFIWRLPEGARQCAACHKVYKWDGEGIIQLPGGQSSVHDKIKCRKWEQQFSSTIL
jgi:hypothetical protein